MASQKEKTAIRSFVGDQLRAETDLSALTVAILKKRYLAHVKSDAFSTEARLYLKEVVQEELRKMLDSDENGSDVENRMPQNKRKREEESEEVVADECVAKKSRLRSNSSEESDLDQSATSDQGEETDRNKSAEEEQEEKKSRQKTVTKMKRVPDSDDSSDEERVESVKKANKKNCSDSPNETIKNKEEKINKETTQSVSQSQEKTALRSDAEEDSDSDSSLHKDDKGGSNSNESNEEEKTTMVEKNEDSDSSSLPSLDEQEKETETTKDEKTKKKQKRGKNTKSDKQENTAVVRLKRYIVLCGVRRNYKKLLGNCKSVSSMVAVLKKELEDLGIKGQPTIEKCKKLKKKRERAQEIAELDVSNIITTQGRPKRRGTSALELTRVEPVTSTHVRSLNSSSESDEENRARTGHKRTTDWGNLQGVISDDASSD